MVMEQEKGHNNARTSEKNENQTQKEDNDKHNREEKEENKDEQENNDIKDGKASKTVTSDGNEGSPSDKVSIVSEGDSFVQENIWNEISLTVEHEQAVPASKDESRKVQNTLQKYKIELSDIEKWKNKNWEKIETLLSECNQSEYKVMKRMVEAIRLEKEKERKENENEKEEMEDIKDTYKKTTTTHNIGTNSNNETHTENTISNEKKHSKSRTNHPQYKKSPPSNNNMRGEGQGV